MHTFSIIIQGVCPGPYKEFITPSQSFSYVQTMTKSEDNRCVCIHCLSPYLSYTSRELISSLTLCMYICNRMEVSVLNRGFTIEGIGTKGMGNEETGMETRKP